MAGVQSYQVPGVPLPGATQDSEALGDPGNSLGHDPMAESDRAQEGTVEEGMQAGSTVGHRADSGAHSSLDQGAPARHVGGAGAGKHGMGPGGAGAPWVLTTVEVMLAGLREQIDEKVHEALW